MSAIRGLKIGGAPTGSAALRTEYPRRSFDRDLWARMRPGEVMVLPASARIPINLRNYSEVHSGATTELSKMPEVVGAGESVVGYDSFED